MDSLETPKELEAFYEHDGAEMPEHEDLPPLLRDGERRRTEVLVRIAAVKPGQRVLDIGCGSGYLLGQIGSAAALAGVDLAESRLEKAKRRLNALGRTADLRKASADALPWDDDEFDVVFCSEVLEHLPRPILAAREIRRVLRPGGCAIISVPNREHIVWVRCIHCGEVTTATTGHLHSFNAASLGALLEEAGLLVRMCRGTYPLINRRGAIGWLLRYLPAKLWYALDAAVCVRLDKGNWLVCQAAGDSVGR